MQLVGVGCGVEVHVAGGGEVDVFAGEVGAGDVEVAVVGEAVCILGAVASGDEGGLLPAATLLPALMAIGPSSA